SYCRNSVFCRKIHTRVPCRLAPEDTGITSKTSVLILSENVVGRKRFGRSGERCLGQSQILVFRSPCRPSRLMNRTFQGLQLKSRRTIVTGSLTLRGPALPGLR